MNFQMKNPNAAKEALLKAAREAAAQPKAEAGVIQKWVAPAECRERIRIFFDDSGSMSGTPVQQAKDGVVEFLRNCIPNQTAVALHFFNTPDEKLATLNSNLIEIATLIKEKRLDMKYTPLFGCVKGNVVREPLLTRGVLFSDGGPNDELVPRKEEWPKETESTLDYWKRNADKACEFLVEHKIPMDTVFFGSASNTNEIEFMKYVAEITEGYFLHFDPAKVNFRTAFKYLAPVNRLMLASESVRREVESGARN